MKKFMALALMAIMIATTVAVAAADESSFPFSFVAYCNDTNRITRDEKDEHIGHKNANDHRLYVRHWVTGGSDAYTNLLRAFNVGRNAYYGSKWATVGVNVPIQSNSIVAGEYTVGGRGNTNHYNYDGVVSVTLHGNCYPNL